MGSRYYITGVQLGMLKSTTWMLNDVLHKQNMTLVEKERFLTYALSLVSQTTDYIEEKQYIGFDPTGESTAVTLIPKLSQQTEGELLRKAVPLAGTANLSRAKISHSELKPIAKQMWSEFREAKVTFDKGNIKQWLINHNIFPSNKLVQRFNLSITKIGNPQISEQLAKARSNLMNTSSSQPSSQPAIPIIYHDSNSKRKYTKRNPLYWSTDGHIRKRKLQLGVNA